VSSPRVTTEEPPDRTRRQASWATVRTQVARVVRVVCGLLATVLAVGVLLVVLRDHVDEHNGAVRLVLDVADGISGPFSRDDGLVDFSGDDAPAKNALLDWGVAAVLYLLAGRLLATLIGPRHRRRPRGSEPLPPG
jgi:hypothetical protein